MATPVGHPVPPFGGFGDEALQFYEGLEADNSRTYWTDYADLYERAVISAAGPPEPGESDVSPRARR